MNDKDKMHPEDMRNLIIFGVLSLLIWFFYDSYVTQPQMKALDNAKKARAELIQNDPQLLEPLKDVSVKEALSASRRVSFSNEEISGTISLDGGRIDDLRLNQYFKTLDKVENVTLLSPAATSRSRYIDYGWVSGNKSLKLPDSSTLWRVKDNDKLQPDLPVTLLWDNGQGLRFEREIALDEEYVFTITQKVINRTANPVALHPYALVAQKDTPEGYFKIWTAYEGPMGFIGGELHQKSYGAMVKDSGKKIEADRGWIGISDKYWLTALIPAQGSMAKYRFKYTPDAVHKARNRYQTDVTGSEISIPAGGSAQNTYHMYTGAKKVITLGAYQKELGVEKLDYAVDFGWFWFFTKPFFFALHYIGLLVGNMGVAIVVLTFVIRTAVFPLTNISYRSFAKMKVVAPQITELRETYKDDKEKLQASIVELYQREGVNPMSGCFPMLAQIPIFFAFYKILFTTIEIRHAPFFGWIQDLSAPDPTSIFNLFGIIPWDPPSMMMIGVWPCVMLAGMLFQKKLNPPPQDKMQRDMMNIFPFFITFIMAGFASGLVIYWAISAILSIIQQAIIMRSMDVPIYLFEKDKFKEELEAKVEEGPDVHPLIEMAEEEAEKAMFGEGEEPEEPPKPIKPPKPKKKKKKK